MTFCTGYFVSSKCQYEYVETAKRILPAVAAGAACEGAANLAAGAAASASGAAAASFKASRREGMTGELRSTTNYQLPIPKATPNDQLPKDQRQLPTLTQGWKLGVGSALGVGSWKLGV